MSEEKEHGSREHMLPKDGGLQEHEKLSEERAERIEHELHKIKTKLEDQKSKFKTHKEGVEQMISTANTEVGGGGMGGLGGLAALAALSNRGGWGTGTALGATGTALGALALLSNLGGRGGLFGGRDGGDGAVTDINAIDNAIEFNTIQQTLGDIKTGVALNQASNEATTLEQTIALNNTLNQLAMGTTAGFYNLKDTVTNQTGLVLAQGANINQNILATGCAIERQIANDGDKTRALIVNQFERAQAEKINALETALAAEAARRHTDGRFNELTITNTNTNTATATAAQLQAQYQQQLQFQNQGALLAQIAAGLGNLTQIAHATNSNIIAGNSGAVLTGPQTSTPTNVSA